MDVAGTNLILLKILHLVANRSESTQWSPGRGVNLKWVKSKAGLSLKESKSQAESRPEIEIQLTF